MKNITANSVKAVKAVKAVKVVKAVKAVKAVKWSLLAAACAAAAGLAACNDGGGGGGGPPAGQTSFTSFVTSTFMAAADSTPVSVDGVVFDYDADNDPTAFDSLIASGSFGQ
jgi:4-hydroxybenzoate polyprenyltransferase